MRPKYIIFGKKEKHWGELPKFPGLVFVSFTVAISYNTGNKINIKNRAIISMFVQ